MIPLKARLSPSDRIAVEESMALKSLGKTTSVLYRGIRVGLLVVAAVIAVIVTIAVFA